MGIFEEKKTLVSVIIPTYGRPNMLKRAINSVLNQTYRNIELIVVDDNGVDGEFRGKTEEIIGDYKNYSSLKYITYQSNMNGSYARNQGIKASHGEYITFLDNDDEMLERKIELQVEKMEKLDEKWGGCYTGYCVQKGGRREISKEKREGKLYLDALARNYFICGGSNLLIRRSVIEDIGLFDESFIRNQDIEFLVRIVEKYKIAYVDNYQLIIYQEDFEERRRKYNYKKNLEIDTYYLEKFSSNIEMLSKRERFLLLQLFSLNRFKVCLSTGELKKGFRDLIDNRVNIITFVRYLFYLFNRAHRCAIYGFMMR